MIFSFIIQHGAIRDTDPAPRPRKYNNMSFKNDLSKTVFQKRSFKNGKRSRLPENPAKDLRAPFSHKTYENTNCVSSCKGKVNRYHKITITYTHFLEINASWGIPDRRAATLFRNTPDISRPPQDSTPRGTFNLT